ncbi:hypothetical protein ACFQL8_28300 [Streptomyces goshikiensis]|uniref:hypothetical protein n=1 Tax=Streptomyces goshikiensis TaxID=1942 RepID=UPI0016742E34|nr:hypothetical protein [Streptomyces goshikiensis]GHD83201.1 hypothetical protein GCM10010336_74120 [Streptomyces goshikiensis]
MSYEQVTSEAPDGSTISAQITVTQAPIVTMTRNALLSAIAREAELVAERSEGQSSAALAELAQAFGSVSMQASLYDPPRPDNAPYPSILSAVQNRFESNLR